MSAPKVNECGNWKAILNKQPIAKPSLKVTGECTFPTPGFSVKLVRAVPQGINPLILILNKEVTPPTGIEPQIITTIPAEYTENPAMEEYTDVTIMPDNTTIKVEVVH